MGTKKPLQAAGRQSGGVVRKTKTRLVPAAKSPQQTPKSRSTPSKLDKTIPVKRPESKESQPTKQSTSSKTSTASGCSKTLKKDSPASTSTNLLSNVGATKVALSVSTAPASSGIKSSSAPGTPKKTQHQQPAAQQQQQKPDEEKAKAINKMLKSLDIKISGFKNIVPEEQKSVECKASISEIVKTKSRAAAAKLTTGVPPKIAKKACGGTQDTGKKVVSASKIIDKNKSASDGKDEERKSAERKNEACQKTKETKSREVVDAKFKDNSNTRTQNAKKTEIKCIQAEETIYKVEEKKNTKVKEDTDKVTQARTSLDSSKVKLTEAQPSKQSPAESSKGKIKEARREESREKQRVTKQLKKGKKTLPDNKELKTGENLNTPQTDPVLDKCEEDSSDKRECLSSKKSEKRSRNADRLEVVSSKTDDDLQSGKNTATKKVSNKTKNQNQGTPSIKGETEEKIFEGKFDNTLEEKASHSDSNEQSSGKGDDGNEILKPTSGESGGNTKKNRPKLKNPCNEGQSPTNVASQMVEKTTELKSNSGTFKEGGEPPGTEPCYTRQKPVVSEKPLSTEKSKNLPEEDFPSKEIVKNKNEQKTVTEKFLQETKSNFQESKVKNVGRAVEQSQIPLRPQLKDSIPNSLTLPKDHSPKPNLSSLCQQSKLLSVRERLQKKYVQNRTITTGFRTFKMSKQPKPVKRSGKMKPQKASKSADPKDKRLEEEKTEKKEKDVYDFKTESESDDNIKMNLLGQSSILSKIRMEKEYSDEDDKPLQLTKLQLKVEKEEKMGKRFGGAVHETKPPPKIQEVAEVKKEDRSAPAPVKRSLGQQKKSVTLALPLKEDKKPARSSKKLAVTSKRKERLGSSDSSSSASDSESDGSTSSSSRLRKSCFGPKRHRMASLNALAKVQCLYENESRTAHELGLSKTAQIPRIRLINSGSSSDEEKDGNKRDLEIKEVKKEKDSVAVETENKRELRNAPGLRGIGKHWDFNDVSSFESGHESDVTFKGRIDFKPKTKKRKATKQKVVPVKDKEKGKEKEKIEQKPKKVIKIQKKKPAPQRRSSTESSDEDDEIGTKVPRESPQGTKKRKRDKSQDIGGDIKGMLARKRMASLNASALVAATYEVERHLDRNLDSNCSSFESFPEDEKPIVVNTSKKLKEIKKDKAEDSGCKENKESGRPTSSSVVIVQDTDVTITGVYVNSSTGSSQEAYCKMQYRVQSSVTEERVLRPSSIDPPKSYTPLGALSSMRPPGATVPPEGQHPAPSQQQQQSVIPPPPPAANIYQSPPISQESPQQNPHIYPPTHHHPTSPTLSAHQHLPEQQPPPPPLHHHHHSQPQLKYPPHLPRHHHYQQQPHQPTPLTQSRCESPVRYQSAAYPPVQAPVPAPPSLSMPGSGSSAFCAPMQQSHHDMSGYYQPAGPLISPHVLPPLPPSNAALVSTKQVPSPLDSDPDQLQQPPPSTSAAESSDSEVLITGGDLTTFRYPTQQQPTQSQQLSVLSSQQASQQGSPYSRSMHQMHYPPAYPPSYYSPYPGDAMCYSPPYQPYFPAKVYQSAPAYRRYPPYYQPGHPPPSDLYEPPPPSSAAPPPPTGSQLVPAGPTAPQHMEHYPGPPGFYSGYSPGGGQCYTRGIQPPYMEYPPPCPCPMQSCPKNVLTGPLIGSNNSGSNSSTNSNSASNALSTNNSSSSSSNNNNSISSNNNSTSNSLNSLSQPLKASKGPVPQVQHPIKTHSHVMGAMEPTTPLSNGSILTKSHLHRHHVHQCKMEILEPLKSDLKTEVGDPLISSDNTKRTQYEEIVVPPTPPSSYTVNDKLIEPEITVSPARGSTGLPTVPDQPDKAASAPAIVVSSSQPPMTATIPRETSDTIVSANLQPTIGRKARIGKSMAREMMYGAHALSHHHPAHAQIYSHAHMHHHLPSHNPPPDMIKVNPPPLPEPKTPVTPVNFGKIKKEEIKKEEEDVVLILDDEKKIKTEPEVVEVFDDKADSASRESPIRTGTPDTDANDEDIPRQPGSKRMKILELNKAQCKKSPPNGYKSLIKQADPKPYLCLSRKSEKKDRFAKITSRGGVRKRKLMLTEQQKKRLVMRKRKLIFERKKRKAEEAAARGKSSTFASTASMESAGFREEGCERDSKKTTTIILNRRPAGLLPANPPEHTVDCVARGYFSEPEMRTSTGRKTKKTKSSEVRSKSETKKSPQQLETATASCITSRAQLSSEQQQQRHKPKSKENSGESSLVKENFEPDKLDSKKRRRDDSTSKGKSSKAAKRAKSSLVESPDVTIFTQDVSQSLLDGSTSVSINNNILESKNNKNKFLQAIEEEEKSETVTPTASEEVVQPALSHRQPTKRTRSRSKFGNKRRHRVRHSANNQLVDPIVIPRKLNVVPRWNNGWSWEGEPFQGKVFLNSDDPLVVRTCYPAMRHAEGDVVQPRDCVLLRAGTKKNELPYVAKVAHLWENPEDGEMMMSLLWYYRPEHTEQGRQPNDNPDEVFASRHRDHNSVACIEDKCYVLTFSEYCRYRRVVRAAEEEIDEEVSVVPSPSLSLNFRQVPVSTNPEQVLFCQRVYDFRLKRLMKTSSSN